ncbi:signal peptidase I [Isoptericola jiangsuensis]|uniref:Signal peptidase I n=1 Tax=Isoptericola jiangsuensis TaxID=548579 RepID=A0A2A9EVH5_9MICO|nr:signal peptidase I [Isoptericola jiangsuensis]PFG42753.1 signal peptidase I [Isoptericola jiangsuensis]
MADSDPMTSPNRRHGPDDDAPASRPSDEEVTTRSESAPAHAAAPSGHRGGRGMSLLRETAIIVVSALVLSWLIKTFLVQAFFIPSSSMEDTLQIGDRVMVSRLVPDVLDVHRGDVVVFKDPGGWLPPYEAPDKGPVGNAVRDAATFVGLLPQDTGEHLIKRVIGMPGDTVECCDAEGRVSVNGVPIDETYIAPGSVPSQTEFSTVVPDDMLFVMGDNRQHSQDSRYNTGKPGGGFVPIDNVVGNAFVIVWPFPDMTLLRNPADVFAEVPEP